MKDKHELIYFIPIIMLIITVLISVSAQGAISQTQSNIYEHNYNIYTPYNTNNSTNKSTNTVVNESFYAVITSTYPGQAQELSLPFNSTGYMMYPDWQFQFFTSAGNTSYTIYLNGGQIAQGYFTFHTTIMYNVSANFANVSIVLASVSGIAQVFNWYNIPILHSSLGSYYKGQTVELPAYTLTQYLELGLKAVLATALAFIGGYSIITRTYVRKKKMEIVRY